MIVSRSGWGAKAPDSRVVLPAGHIEGIAIHWSAGPGPADHSRCAETVRGIQAFHMGPQRGWADIAYSFLVCRHGTVYEGRGWGVRTAANGSFAANSAYHAACYIGDASTPFTVQAKAALDSLIAEGQRRYPQAKRVEPHSRFFSTSCPGPTISAWITGRPVPKGDEMPPWFPAWFEWRLFDGNKATRPKAAPDSIPQQYLDIVKQAERFRALKPGAPELQHRLDTIVRVAMGGS